MNLGPGSAGVRVGLAAPHAARQTNRYGDRLAARAPPAKPGPGGPCWLWRPGGRRRRGTSDWESTRARPSSNSAPSSRSAAARRASRPVNGHPAWPSRPDAGTVAAVPAAADRPASRDWLSRYPGALRLQVQVARVRPRHSGWRHGAGGRAHGPGRPRRP